MLCSTYCMSMLCTWYASSRTVFWNTAHVHADPYSLQLCSKKLVHVATFLLYMVERSSVHHTVSWDYLACTCIVSGWRTSSCTFLHWLQASPYITSGYAAGSNTYIGLGCLLMPLVLEMNYTADGRLHVFKYCLTRLPDSHYLQETSDWSRRTSMYE